MVFELIGTNEKLIELADKKNVDSLKVQDQVKRIDMLNEECLRNSLELNYLGKN